MKRKLDLTNWTDRRELKARARTRLLREPEYFTQKISWALKACEEKPDHQENWQALDELLK